MSSREPRLRAIFLLYLCSEHHAGASLLLYALELADSGPRRACQERTMRRAERRALLLLLYKRLPAPKPCLASSAHKPQSMLRKDIDACV